MTEQEMLYNQTVNETYRALRKHSFTVGVCLLFGFAAQEIIVVIMYALGFGKLLETNLAFQYAVSGLVLTVFSMMVPFFFYSLRKGKPSFVKALPFYSDISRSKLILIIVAGFGLCIAANGVANLSGIIFSFVGIESDIPEVPVSQNALDIFMSFIASAAIAPLVEEFIFRGVIMQPLRRYGDRFAIIASAAVFGLAHVRVTNIVFAFVSGIIIGCAVVYSRSIWVGIIIHALNNAFSTLFIEIDNVAPDAVNMIYLYVCIALAVVGIVAFIAYGKKYGLRMRCDESSLGVRKKFVGFFLTVPMVLTIIYYLTNIIRNL